MYSFVTCNEYSYTYRSETAKYKTNANNNGRSKMNVTCIPNALNVPGRETQEILNELYFRVVTVINRFISR